jgi:hypothetical protein
MKNLSLLTYTHSNASDIHDIYFDSIEKHFGVNKHVVLCDIKLPRNGLTMSLYDNSDKYYKQMIDGLRMVTTDYVIYSQEDYILFNNVDLDKITNLIKVLDNDNEISFIRLIYSGIDFPLVEYNEDLFYLNSNHDYFFSTQITIWRTKDLIEMFEASMVETIWDELKNSKYLSNLGKIGLCVKDKGEPVGGHYNSVIYPYIATAIVKGKWNYSEYKNHLDLIFNQYNVNINKRGIR